MTPSLPRVSVPAPPPLAQSDRGDVRVGPLAAIPGLVQEFGASPRRVFARAGVSLREFRNLNSRMTMDRLAHLMQVATSATGRSDFAIIAGLRFEMRGLGPIGELMQHSVTVGEALRNLVLHLHLHDRGAAPVLMRLDVETSLLGYSVYRFGTPALNLVYDTSTGILHRILSTLCGPAFKAKAVQVSGHRPASAVPYRKHFGCAARFDSRISGVVFASRWMEHSIIGADPVKRLALQKAIEAAEERSPMTFGQRAEVVTQQMLLSGAASSTAIADLFGISERTLRRRLGDEGLSMRGLLDAARYDQARQLLQYTDLPVGDIAATLQYQDANAFSRAFRSWAGCTATLWRARSRRKGRSACADDAETACAGFGCRVERIAYTMRRPTPEPSNARPL